MDYKTKDAALLIFIVLTILGFLLALNMNLKANKFNRGFQKEMAFRLDLEEGVNKLRSEKMDLTNMLMDKDLEIKKNKELIENLNQVISEQQADIKKLQSELEKLTLLKDKLEDNLKEELIKQSNKSK